MISGGLVFLAILAERCFGFQLGRWQWTGLLVTAVGLAVLGLAAAPATHEHASAAALIAVECAVIVISGVLICASIRLERLQLREGIFLATAAGALFGTSDIAINHLAHPRADPSDAAREPVDAVGSNREVTDDARAAQVADPRRV